MMTLSSKIEGVGEFRAGGVFSINKGAMAGFFGTVLTYVIILMTWPGAEDDNIPDYLKDLCCYAFNDLRKETEQHLNYVRN